ncbi:MAG: hypothetical protein RLO01_09215 [Thalassobaculaceae bacterium]
MISIFERRPSSRRLKTGITQRKTGISRDTGLIKVDLQTTRLFRRAGQ